MQDKAYLIPNIVNYRNKIMITFLKNYKEKKRDLEFKLRVQVFIRKYTSVYEFTLNQSIL